MKLTYDIPQEQETAFANTLGFDKQGSPDDKSPDYNPNYIADPTEYAQMWLNSICDYQLKRSVSEVVKEDPEVIAKKAELTALIATKEAQAFPK